jgi:hypothetical protein
VTKIRNVYCLALAAVVFSLWTATASAQAVQVVCAFAPPYPTWLITVDIAAQTIGADNIDAAGNVTIMAYHRMHATITDETVSADWESGQIFMRFRLNRYSLVLLWGANGGAGYHEYYSSPCTPYQRGQKKI